MMGVLSEHDQVQQFDRIGEWDEDLFAAEWAASVDPDVAFRGWHRLDTIAARIAEYEASVEAGRAGRLAEYQRSLVRRQDQRLAAARVAQ